MSIIGIGTDIVDINRIESIHRRYADRFVERLLAPSERSDYRAVSDRTRPAAAFLARRFAAKEAAAKALGSGIGAQAKFTEVAIEHTRAGAPVLAFTGATRHSAILLGMTRSHLSISDELEHALAFVVIEGWRSD